MSTALLRGVDLAAFAVALSTRLRSQGACVGLTAMEDAVRALVLAPPLSRSGLYWTTRVTLIRRHEDVAVFDQVFGLVFEEALLPLDPHARRHSRGSNASVESQSSGSEEGSGLPWITLPQVVADAGDSDSANAVPHRLPSQLTGPAEQPFEQLSPEELQQLGRWLESTIARWPTRRSRRAKVSRNGSRVDLRASVLRARRTGWEPVHLVHTQPRPKPRRVVMLCDVSQSMQAPSVAYLHLMRALVLHANAEAFAFATALTRLTRVLAHRSAPEAFEVASSTVSDRFGGTRIASNLHALLASEHGGLLRGAVVLIASDGWDSDPPELMTKVMTRLRRRAHRVVWINPRAAAAGFEPRVATMAAALAHCHALLPADSFAALAQVLEQIPLISSRGSREWTDGNARPLPRRRAASPGSPAGSA